MKYNKYEDYLFETDHFYDFLEIYQDETFLIILNPCQRTETHIKIRLCFLKRIIRFLIWIIPIIFSESTTTWSKWLSESLRRLNLYTKRKEVSEATGRWRSFAASRLPSFSYSYSFSPRNSNRGFSGLKKYFSWRNG